MRILMVTNNYVDRTRGGVEMHVFNLAQALTKGGHEVTVARTSPGPGIHSADGQGNVWTVLGRTQETARDRSSRISKLPLLRFGSNFIGRIATAVKAGRILRRDTALLDSFDLIHHHDFVTSAIIARMLHRSTARQVWTNHLGEFLILRRIPVIGIAITKFLTRPFQTGIGPSAELSDSSTVSCSINYVPNGVNTEIFAPLSDHERLDKRSRRGLTSDQLVAIVPRRWAPTKGVVYAAKAMSLDCWPVSCSTIFAGAGETEFPEYSAEIRDALALTSGPFEIIDSLSIYGMAEALQIADFCIVPSLMEATSLSALEAMSVGLPIVSTNVGGLPEIVHEGINGFLVPSSDSEALATAVSNICQLSSAERAAMGSAAREHVVSNYSWREIAERTMEIYKVALR